MGRWTEKLSQKAVGAEPSKPSKETLEGLEGTCPSDSSEDHVLSSKAKARLRTVVDKLTGDCVRWYQADEDILTQLSDEALEFAVLEFLSKREWYLRRQGVAQ
jgi:hypothetical protein